MKICYTYTEQFNACLKQAMSDKYLITFSEVADRKDKDKKIR